MAQYTAIFTKPYADGYENLPSQNTPITAQTLNDKDDAIVNIETYLSTNDIPSDAEGLSYDNTDSGLTADNVQGAVDELADEKIDKTGVDVKTNATGQFNTITGGLMQKCEVKLGPIQSGSGTPSPSNVRPITGHTQVQVGNVGKNKFTPTGKTANYFLNSSGTPVSSNGWNYSDYLPISGETITMSTQGEGVGNSPSICFYDLNKTFISGEAYANALIKTFTVPPNAVYCRASYYNLWESTYQIEKGSQATGYEPYNGYTKTIALGQTVYGGSVDVVNGTGSDEWANIASYNGETITEPWLSSMDEYVSGTTPTTGAQVVYKKATASSITFTPSNLETLIGQNTVSVPLDGQSLDSLTYREVVAWDDVERAINVKLDLSSVAPIEYTDKASQSYNQKQLFIKDNKLCQALASISSGASFTENTNFKYTTLAEIIEPLIP